MYMKDVRRDIERGIRDTAPNNLSVAIVQFSVEGVVPYVALYVLIADVVAACAQLRL